MSRTRVPPLRSYSLSALSCIETFYTRSAPIRDVGYNAVSLCPICDGSSGPIYGCVRVWYYSSDTTKFIYVVKKYCTRMYVNIWINKAERMFALKATQQFDKGGMFSIRRPNTSSPIIVLVRNYVDARLTCGSSEFEILRLFHRPRGCEVFVVLDLTHLRNVKCAQVAHG